MRMKYKEQKKDEGENLETKEEKRKFKRLGARSSQLRFPVWEANTGGGGGVLGLVVAENPQHVVMLQKWILILGTSSVIPVL
jgi:hypothetical protein